ncbi:hypothetical protein K1719_041851 [Acacia pycnantha]|nr:hypothetical protein K1719_041851 [Acacia pycnantha]
MAVSARFSLLLLFLLSSLLHTSFSADPPQISPSPSPSLSDLSPASTSSPSPLVSSSAPDSAPASSPLGFSPPAPSPDNQSPTPSPSPSPSLSPSPAPEPADGSLVSHTGVSAEEGTADSSSGGMNAGKKAGVALGVIAAAGVVVFAVFVVRKRQQNIQRSQYAYTARREIL